jgi:thiosulfate/3-mercaptopyruvate sulfurtransferase
MIAGRMGGMVEPFVDAAWLARHEVVLADVRWYLDGRSGREAFRVGHLPGAVFVDLDVALSGAPGPDGRHPLPTPEHFAEQLSRNGIGDDDVVVAYDDAGGVMAARLVWMLRATGRDAALLDGGMSAWTGPLETGEPARSPAGSTPRPWPAHLLADLDQAVAAARSPSSVLLDARPTERYAGTPHPADPRAGHVPGAVSLPARNNVGADGTLLPQPVLAERITAAGVVDAADVVSSCGSGVTACHTLLVLEHLGLGRGRLWPGSWSQYASDPGRPVG